MFLSGCVSAQQTDNFQLENLKSDIRINSALSEKGASAVGPIGLARVETADLIYIISKNGKLSEGRTRLGAISLEVTVKKIADDKYDNVLILAFSFPAKDKAPVKSARSVFQFTTSLSQLAELRTKTEQKSKDIHKMAEMWANAVEEQGKKEGYEYQNLFSYTLKKALVAMGERFLNTFPATIETLVNKYPQVIADIEKQGGFEATVKKNMAAEKEARETLEEVDTGYGRIAKGMTIAEVEKILPSTSRAFKNDTRMGYKDLTIYDKDWRSQTAGLWIELENDKVKSVKVVK